MIVEKIDLYAYFNKEKPQGAKGTLLCYIHSQYSEMGKEVSRPAMLVIPGGGYAFVSQREGEPIAEKFYAQGYNTFILDYSIAPDFCYPTSHIEACMAMLYIRQNAEKLGVIKDKVAAIGFSAGGHLTGVLSLLSDRKEIINEFGENAKLTQPDASVYSYAVITSNVEHYHGGSFANLCADKYNFDDFSLEKKVTKTSSPAFIWATFDDGCVPAQNSLMLANAYLTAGVPCELHIYESGVHGLSTCGKDVAEHWMPQNLLDRVAGWQSSCFAFLRDKGFDIIWKE